MEYMSDCSILLEEIVLLPLITYIKKNGAIICPLFLSEFIVSGKKIHSIILVVVTAHHSPTLIMSCNDTSCIRLGLSND